MTVGERIKKRREALGLSQVDLAQKANISKQTLYKYENGIVTNIPSDKIELIANILRTSPAHLMGWETPTFQSGPFGRYRIPVLSSVAAGKPIYAEEDVLEWIDYDKDPGDHVKAVKIEGNSMIPRIQNGDTVIFDTDLEWEDGNVVIATVNGDHATCKRIKRYADGIALLSDNPDVAPMYFSKQEVSDLPVRVIGRVVEVREKI